MCLFIDLHIRDSTSVTKDSPYTTKIKNEENTKDQKKLHMHNEDTIISIIFR